MRVAAITVLLGSACFSVLASDTDTTEIRNLISSYAKSVDAADPALADRVWSSSGDVSFIHPLGYEHGLEQVKQDVYGRIMGAMFSDRDLSIHDAVIHVYGNTAWAEFLWDFTAKRRSDGSSVKNTGRETQIYRKEGGRWRLVHVHYSPQLAPMPSAK